MPYADFDVTFDPNDVPVATEQMRYLEGFDLPAQQTVSTGATQYLHGDLIDSTMLMTDDNGAAVGTTAYTAFGELVTGYSELATRYQYAGGWGYETGGFGDDPGLLILNGAPGTAPITLQHVGHRWYDPSIGRFLQRDPIGILGGFNCYAYLAANPTNGVDPDGLDRWVSWGMHTYIIVWDPVTKSWKRIDFVPAPGVTLWGPGTVLVGAAPGPSGTRIPSSASDDAALLDFARDLRDYYSWNYNILFFNCIHFTNILKDYPQGPPPKPKSPPRPINPCPIPSSRVCFVGETLVAVEGAWRAIDEITVGDCITIFDIDGKRSMRGRVRAAQCSGSADELVEIAFAGERVVCTPNHPFATAQRGWLAARDLVAGERLVTTTGATVPVESVQRFRPEHPVPVYDLKTPNGTYFVGRAGVLVHSVCSREPTTGKAEASLNAQRAR